MKILVTGGSGFLGSHLADKLSDAGHKVIIYDLKKSKWLKKNQKMVVGDILDAKIIEKEIKNSDIVYHFAGLSDLEEALDKPIETVKRNILGTVNILELCKKYKIRRFIFASTIYVYSHEGGFYKSSKRAAEDYIEEYEKKYNLKYTILRFGSLYGPRSDNSNGLYKIVFEAIKNNRITYMGNKESKREYIHVEDAANSCMKILEKEFINKNVIISGNESMKVYELMQMISEILGIKKKLKFIKTNLTGHYTFTPYSYSPKLGKKMNPPLHVDFGQGIIQLIEEIRNNLNEKKD